jgi:hypothetical protein
MMMAAKATALTLGTLTIGTMATIVDDRPATRDVQDLLDHGFEVVAKGELLDRVECERFTLRILPAQPPDSCQPKYGSFKRLKGNDGEFVCVSFRDWACYPSRNSNQR